MQASIPSHIGTFGGKADLTGVSSGSQSPCIVTL
jgi:hypothetical protein